MTITLPNLFDNHYTGCATKVILILNVTINNFSTHCRGGSLYPVCYSQFLRHGGHRDSTLQCFVRCLPKTLHTLSQFFCNICSNMIQFLNENACLSSESLFNPIQRGGKRMFVYTVGECLHIVCINRICFFGLTNIFEQEFFVNLSRMNLYIKHLCCYKYSHLSLLTNK